MEWLLIIVLNNGKAIQTQEFNTERSCKVAALTVKDMDKSTKVQCIKIY